VAICHLHKHRLTFIAIFSRSYPMESVIGLPAPAESTFRQKLW
jgi:hypothetical protein